MVKELPVDKEWREVRTNLRALTNRKRNSIKRIGFTVKEANRLSKTSFKAPYIKDLIKDRRELLNESIKAKESKFNFHSKIRNMYYMYEWVDDEGNPSFWEMIRWYERYGREKYPDWKTPHAKKRVSKKDQGTFDEKWEATGQKYPPGYGKNK